MLGNWYITSCNKDTILLLPNMHIANKKISVKKFVIKMLDNFLCRITPKRKEKYQQNKVNLYCIYEKKCVKYRIFN